MNVVDITAYLADIERQMKAWLPDKLPMPGEPPLRWPEHPQPVYIVGEGQMWKPAIPIADEDTYRSSPAGWPAVGERVKCERCNGLGYLHVTESDPHEFTPCPDCNGEGSTLPRVELTVRCSPHMGRLAFTERGASGVFDNCPNCPDSSGTVPWGSALWQTLPVAEQGGREQDGAYVLIIDKQPPILMWAEEAEVLPLDPASVRPGIDFVGVATKLVMAA